MGQIVNGQKTTNGVVDAIKAGVNNYVVKPFTPDMLMEKVKQTLDRCHKVAA